MSKTTNGRIELRIILDRSNHTYTAEEVISGHIDVNVFEDCQCKELTIATEWHSRKRDKASGAAPARSLFSGEWRKGERLCYPFFLTAFAGPTIVSRRTRRHVDWRLAAHAAFGDSSSVEIKEKFVLVKKRFGLVRRYEEIASPSEDERIYFPVRFGVWGVLFGLLGLVLSAGSDDVGLIGRLIAIVFSVVLLLIGLHMLFGGIRETLETEKDRSVPRAVSEIGLFIRIVAYVLLSLFTRSADRLAGLRGQSRLGGDAVSPDGVKREKERN